MNPHALLHLLLTPHGILYLGCLALFMLALNVLSRSFWLFSLAALPGTFFHETAHYLSALLLNGDPRQFTILPKREGKRWVLGYVMIHNPRWYNALFIGLAPLALLPAGLELINWRLSHHAAIELRELPWIYVAACLLNRCLPSIADLQIASRSWPLVVATAAAFAAMSWHRYWL